MCARELAPGMSARSAYYQFVSSEVEARPLVSLDVVRRALDLDPDLEVAQFSLAFAPRCLENASRARAECRAKRHT